MTTPPLPPLPPYAEVLGLSLTEDGALMMPFGDGIVGRPGFLHGGAISGLLELAAFRAVHTALADRAVRIKPINITVDFMRGGRPRDTFAIGHVSRLGTRIANVEAVAWQDNRDTPIAAARINLLLKRPRA